MYKQHIQQYKRQGWYEDKKGLHVTDSSFPTFAHIYLNTIHGADTIPEIIMKWQYMNCLLIHNVQHKEI